MSTTAPATADTKPAAQASTEAAGQGSNVKPTTEGKPQGTEGAKAPAAPAGSDSGKPSTTDGKTDSKPKADGTQSQTQGEVKFDLKLPKDSLLKPEAVDSFKAFAKEQGWTEKQAQAQLERESKALFDRQEAEKADLAGKVEVWKKSIVDHKDLGGNNLVRTTTRCDAALKRFDREGKLKGILEATGLGNLPEVVEYLEGVGAALEGDKIVVAPPVAGSGGVKADKDVFYKD